MQALSVSGYPRNLSYICKKLSGYSRNNFKLQTLNQSSATNGNIITVDLPTNALVDLSTLTWFFTGTTTTSAGFANFPRNIECIIERLEVEINGQIINGGCQSYNQLWQIISDTTFGNDVRNRRSILQNGADVGVPAANQTNVQYAIQNWLGFLGSVSPNIIDTSLLGNVRVRITLSTPAILVQSAAATGAAFSLTNMFFSVDTIDIADGMFHQIHDQFLAGGGVYELPYNNFFSFSSTSGLSQTTKFSLSTQSLNRVWATFVPGTTYKINSINGVTGTAGAYQDPQSKTSPYFTRISGGSAGQIVSYGDGTNSTPVTYTLTGYQLSVNNVFYPNWIPTAEQAYALMLNSYGLSQDTVGGGYPGLTSLAQWTSSFWLAENKFDHGSDGVTLISGIDTRGSTAQAYFQSYGTISVGANVGTGGANPGTNLTALVFAQTTSTLRVGQGRQLEIIL